jgi:hypothetical protein
MQDIPYLKETELHIRLFAVNLSREACGHPIEMADEALNGLALGRSQILERILQRLEVNYICKQSRSIDKVFIDIVEISQQHIAPENEFIQSFRFRIQFPIALVELYEQPHPV